MRKRLSFGAIALTALLTGIAVGYAQQPTDGSNSPASGSTPPAVADSAISSRAATFIGALRRERGATDDVPARVADSALLADGIADARSSRRVDLPSGDTAWLLPGRDESVCVAHDGFLNCPPAEEIRVKGVSIYVSARGSEVHIGGIAADGVRNIRIALADGRTIAAAIRDNVFDIRAEMPPTRVTWQGSPSGSQVFDPGAFGEPDR